LTREAEMNKYGFKKGDLLRWTDYTATDDTHSPILRRRPKSVVGLFLGMRPALNMNLAGDIIVLVGDKRVNWDGWQCDKLEKGEWTCK
jgi:hypothetical protein